MVVYDLAEKFISINGEGTRAGRLALFLRFKGCNLNCSFCDTKWANEDDCECEKVTDDDLYEYVVESGIKNVTITGGEPLFRKDMDILLKKLSTIDDIYIEIETNGSIDIGLYKGISDKITFTMDYKLPGSKMSGSMRHDNFHFVGPKDTVKFVVSSERDLDVMREIIDQYSLAGRTNIYVSPVFGEIEPRDIVEYMIKHRMNDVNMQLQMHKYIWDKDMKGV